jgi:hypothetical protein
MKRASLLLLCLPVGLLACPAHAQSAGPDSLTQIARYQHVVPVPGASAEELYSRAQEWVAQTFEDPRQVIQFADPQRHLLLGSGYTQLLFRRNNGTVRNTAPLWFSFRLEARAGRYRLECSDFASVPVVSSGVYAEADVAYWLKSGQATRAASSRHSAPGATWNELIRGDYPEDKLKAKQTLEEAVGKLFTTLQQVETAPTATW